MIRLAGNPVCSNANVPNISQFCLYLDQGDARLRNLTSSCPVDACPADDNYEYIPSSPVSCYCASPLRIGYRLKSPSFSYFPPYVHLFEDYMTRSLNFDLYQLSIDTFSWETGGPRLRMYLKIFPTVNKNHSHMFNATEVQRIRDIFASWAFPHTDLFGPYELLNFTLQGPYSNSKYFACFSLQHWAMCQTFHTKWASSYHFFLLKDSFGSLWCSGAPNTKFKHQQGNHSGHYTCSNCLCSVSLCSNLVPHYQKKNLEPEFTIKETSM